MMNSTFFNSPVCHSTEKTLLHDIVTFWWPVRHWAGFDIVCIIQLCITMAMSRCLIISQAYKRPIELPVAAVTLIDGVQAGPQCCPQTYSVYSYRLPSAHFTHHRVQLAKFTVIMGGKKMLIRLHSPKEIQKHIFKPNFPNSYQVIRYSR